MKRLSILALLALTLSACLHQADDPRDVATQYWQALKNGDSATARSLVAANSLQAFDDYMALPQDRRIAIGDVNLGTEQTTIITIVYLDSTAPEDFETFDTVLIMEDGKWKIDAERTIVPRPPPSEKELDELADQLSDSMQDNIDSLEEAMNEGLKMLNDALREGSRDMGESMLKGMEEMNRALRESIEEMQKRQEQQDTKKKGDGEGLI